MKDLKLNNKYARHKRYETEAHKGHKVRGNYRDELRSKNTCFPF